MRFVLADAEMMKLNLSLGPGERGGAIERHSLVMLVCQIERFLPRGSNQCPECDAHGSPRRNPDATANADDRIEHGSDSVAQRGTRGHGDRRPSLPSTTDEAGAVGLELDLADALAFDDGKMRDPDLGLAGRPRPTRRQHGADIGGEFRLDE